MAEKRVERTGGNSWELRRFHTSQLIEELARRQNEAPCAKPDHWCHDCGNYVAWYDLPRKGEMPDSFNACTKGHAMKFIAPEEFDAEYGFYRRVCADREMGTKVGGGAEPVATPPLPEPPRRGCRPRSVPAKISDATT